MYAKKIIPFFTFLICLLNFNLVYSSKFHKNTINIDSVGNSTHQEIIDEYVRVANEELTQIIAQNAINDLNGESQKNNYIFGFEHNIILLENKYLGQFNQPLLTNITILNNHLVSLNATLKTRNKPLIYIGIDALLGEILSKIEVSGIQTTPKLEQITIQKQDFDSFENIKNAYNSIYDRIGNDLTDLDSSHPNGMIILGYGIFKKYTIDSEIDSDELSTAYIKSKIKDQKWQACNFKEKKQGSPVGQGSDAFRALVFQNFSKFPESPEPDDVQEYLQNFATQVYNSLTGDKVFIPKGRLHKDLYAPDGEYRLKFDTDVTEEQVLKVNALIEEMMNDPLYENYIKPAITTKTQGGYKLKQADLINMEKGLISLKKACQKAFEKGDKDIITFDLLTKLLNFLKLCSNSTYTPCLSANDGYLPRCLWDNASGSIPTIPFGPTLLPPAVAAGMFDGGVETLVNIGTLIYISDVINFQLPTCWLIAPLNIDKFFFGPMNCAELREKSIEYFTSFKEYVDNPNAPTLGQIFSQVGTTISQDFATWKIDLNKIDNCGLYVQGKLAFDILSSLVPIGPEVKLAGSVTKFLTKFTKYGAKGLKILAKPLGQALKFVPQVSFNAGKKTIVGLALMTTLSGAEQSIAKIVTKEVITSVSGETQDLARKIVVEATQVASNTEKEAIAVALQNVSEEAIHGAFQGVEGELVEKIASETGNKIVKLAKSDIDFIIKSIPAISPTSPIIIASLKAEDGTRVAFAMIKEGIIKSLNRSSDSQQEPCVLCSARKVKQSDALCTKLQKLASLAFTSTTGNTAVNKLCANIASATVLEAVVDKLLALPTSDGSGNHFLENIATTTCGIEHICNDANVAQISTGLIDAWKMEFDAIKIPDSKLLGDWETLTTIKMIQNEERTIFNNFINVVNSNDGATGFKGTPDENLSTFLQRYKIVDCKICKNPSTYGIPTLLNVWMNAKYINNLYDNGVISAKKIVNTNTFLYPTITGNSWSFSAKSGGNHMITDMRNNSFSSSQIEDLDNSFTYVPQGEPTKKYDLRKKNNEGYIEYKSYSESYGLEDAKAIGNGDWKDFDQFVSYLRQTAVVDLKGITLEYVFDKKKIPNEKDIKEAFQKLICSNCDNNNDPTKTLTVQGKKVFDTIWGNVGLRNNLFGNIPSQNLLTEKPIKQIQFLSWIETLNTNVFGFIKSR